MRRLKNLFSDDRFNLTLLTVFNLLLRLLFLAGLPAYFDEKAFYLEGARSYLTGFTDPNFEHPPLSKEIFALGIKIFGDNPWGWRTPSVLFGILGIVVTYLLAKKLFKNTKIALLSGFLLTFDFLWFVHSRIAVPEIFLAVFSLLAVYFFWSYYQKQKSGNLLLFGIFLGLALAVKWSAVFIIFGVVVFTFLDRLHQGKKRSYMYLLLGVLVALFVYFLSFIPYLNQDHNFSQVLERQYQIWQYHISTAHPSANGAVRPYLWLFNPIQLYFHPTATSNQFVLALSNPFFFWGSIAALIIYLRSLIKKWQSEIGFLVVLVLSLYLPWFFIRRYTFFYYILSALPFLALIMANGLVNLNKVKGEWGERYTLLRKVLLTGNALGFILFYPLLVALPVTNLYLNIVLAAFK